MLIFVRIADIICNRGLAQLLVGSISAMFIGVFAIQNLGII